MEALFASTPAMGRLRWLLEGLTGRWPREPGAAAVLAPEFAAAVSPGRFVAVMRERAARLAPIRVVGMDDEGASAAARFRGADGELWFARVTVEAEAPHRVVSAYAQPWVPDHLTPGLPAEFTPDDFGGATPATGSALVVFAGVPGSGKSAVAERVGVGLGLPVFALDWLLGALSPFGMRHRLDLRGIGDELLVTLAYRELLAGRSAVIDTTSEDVASRGRWTSLAVAAGATLVPVVCVCSDAALHRHRVESRQRSIPGWQDVGVWSDATSRLAGFLPWPGSVTVDTVLPLDDCVAQVVRALPRRS